MYLKYYHDLINTQRVQLLKEHKSDGAVVYLMNRDQRTNDNHALSFAQALAILQKKELIVAFILDTKSGRYNSRQIPFMLSGLKNVSDDLKSKNIPFILIEGDTTKELTRIVNTNSISSIVFDFSPLKKDKELLKHAMKHYNSAIYLVDAHNIVPCWVASEKREFAAYTIRPKIFKKMNKYSEKALPLVKHSSNKSAFKDVNWSTLLNTYNSIDFNNMFESGEEAAFRQLERFIAQKFEKYADERNDPTKEMQSDISPYLHFGQISARTILERVQMTQIHEAPKEQFIDELVIRRELSDNFCYYTDNYDSFDAFPDWAKESLDLHRVDKRPYTYTREQFEKSETDDPLWNAAQNQLLITGKMHGYMRMYWAKKILEWTKTPEQALDIAICLNDRYELDGNDPNGYAGIAWSIGGVHDRAWFEREIYGKVRYMNANGCKRKFDVDKYIRQYTNINQMNFL